MLGCAAAGADATRIWRALTQRAARNWNGAFTIPVGLFDFFDIPTLSVEFTTPSAHKFQSTSNQTAALLVNHEAFTFLLIALASLAMAVPSCDIRKTTEEIKGVDLKYPGKGLWAEE